MTDGAAHTVHRNRGAVHVRAKRAFPRRDADRRVAAYTEAPHRAAAPPEHEAVERLDDRAVLGIGMHRGPPLAVLRGVAVTALSGGDESRLRNGLIDGYAGGEPRHAGGRAARAEKEAGEEGQPRTPEWALERC